MVFVVAVTICKIGDVGGAVKFTLTVKIKEEAI